MLYVKKGTAIPISLSAYGHVTSAHGEAGLNLLVLWEVVIDLNIGSCGEFSNYAPFCDSPLSMTIPYLDVMVGPPGPQDHFLRLVASGADMLSNCKC